MSEWKSGTLSDIALITMGQSPSGDTCNLKGIGVPLLNGPTEFGIKHPAPVQFTIDPRKTCKQHDILFCVRGSTTGRMNWANREYAIGRGLAAISHKQGSEYQHFLKGIIDFNLPLLLQGATGSTFPNVSAAEIQNLVIDIPPLDEQKRISKTLSSLDNKIDLLHRQNETLEALAETLFRQWFIVEADECWEVKSLDKIANYLNGLALQKFPVSDENDYLPVIKIREIKQGITGNTDKCNTNIPKQYIVNDGDILFSWSGSLEVAIWYDGIGALNQHLFKVTSEDYPKWFYYLATKHHLPEFRNIAHTKSTTMGHIQRHHLAEATISLPPGDKFKLYDAALAPMIEKIIKNNAQIKSLTQLRDTLLPKLMSGEVRVESMQEEMAVV